LPNKEINPELCPVGDDDLPPGAGFRLQLLEKWGRIKLAFAFFRFIIGFPPAGSRHHLRMVLTELNTHGKSATLSSIIPLTTSRN
jgi:hypothetical protein